LIKSTKNMTMTTMEPSTELKFGTWWKICWSKKTEHSARNSYSSLCRQLILTKMG